MKFRPCIDIHNGTVKQIVGGSLKDAGDFARENFVSSRSAAYYAKLYESDDLGGGHVIMLNSRDSEYFEATEKAALEALGAYPGGLQIGGGINADNAMKYIKAGASHVIVTGFAFSDGRINHDNIRALRSAVGKDRVVLDLSAGLKDGDYYVVTDRWQKFTDEKLRPELFEELSEYCDEFLVHAKNVEGLKQGPDLELVRLLSECGGTITYAGGIGEKGHIDAVREASGGRLDFTVGSALDLFGGTLSYDEIKKYK